MTSNHLVDFPAGETSSIYNETSRITSEARMNCRYLTTNFNRKHRGSVRQHGTMNKCFSGESNWHTPRINDVLATNYQTTARCVGKMWFEPRNFPLVDSLDLVVTICKTLLGDKIKLCKLLVVPSDHQCVGLLHRNTT